MPLSPLTTFSVSLLFCVRVGVCFDAYVLTPIRGSQYYHSVSFCECAKKLDHVLCGKITVRRIGMETHDAWGSVQIEWHQASGWNMWSTVFPLKMCFPVFVIIIIIIIWPLYSQVISFALEWKFTIIIQRGALVYGWFSFLVWNTMRWYFFFFFSFTSSHLRGGRTLFMGDPFVWVYINP